MIGAFYYTSEPPITSDYTTPEEWQAVMAAWVADQLEANGSTERAEEYRKVWGVRTKKFGRDRALGMREPNPTAHVPSGLF
jgi:hypothetical protein